MGRLKQAKYYYLWCLRSMVGKIAAMTGAHSACLDTTYNLVLPRTATPAHRQSNICKVGESGKPAAHLASFLREPHAYWCMLQGQRRTAWHAEAGASDEAAMSRQKSNLPWIHDAAPCFSNRALVVCRRGRSTWPARKINSWHHAALILLRDVRLRKQGLGEQNAHVHVQPFHPACLPDLHRHRPSK